jgi:hypothetical protein
MSNQKAGKWEGKEPGDEGGKEGWIREGEEKGQRQLR